jgi:hypothetical protein
MAEAAIGLPPGRSTRMTSAPMSASSIPANGPGPIPASSTIVVPDRGPGTETSGGGMGLADGTFYQRR